jgi:hypothetical protein
MKFSRRTMLRNALFAAVATQAARSFAAMSGPAPVLWRVFDSRVAASRVWLGFDTGWAIDVAHEAATRWVRLRGLSSNLRVAGMTSWSDFVQVRGLLQERRKRLRVESRNGELFYWEMV